MTVHAVTIHRNDWPLLAPSDIAATSAAVERRGEMRRESEVAAVLAGHDVVRIVDQSGVTIDVWPVDTFRIYSRITTRTHYRIRGPRGGMRNADTMEAAESDARKASVKTGARHEVTAWLWRGVVGVHGVETLVRSVVYKGGKVVR